MRKIGLVRTFSPKVSEIQRSWYVVDADGLVLGRLASSVAAILRGKHRPYFAPHVDTGDHVIVVNADKVVLTSNKADAKLAYRHSGYPGGLRSTTYAELLEEKPAELIRRSVRGMLPEEHPRPPDARQAPGLRRARPPARGPEARAARTAPGPPRRLSRTPATAPGRNHPRNARTTEPDHRTPQAGGGARALPPRPGRHHGQQAPHRALLHLGHAPHAGHRAVAGDQHAPSPTTSTPPSTGAGSPARPAPCGSASRAACARSTPSCAAPLKRSGLLTRDAREKESKKYGLKKARKAPQYSKR